MRFSRLTTAVIALIAMFTIASLPNSARAQAQNLNRIAIANPVKIFNDLQETKDLRQKMESDAKTAEAERLTKQSTVNDLKQKRDVYQPQAPKFAELNQQYLQAAIEFDTWGKIRSLQLQNDQKM